MSCSLQQKNPMLHFIYWEQFLGLFLDFHEFFMLSKIADQSFHRLCLKESLSHIFIPMSIAVFVVSCGRLCTLLLQQSINLAPVTHECLMV